MHDLWVSKRLLKRPPTAEDVPNVCSTYLLPERFWIHSPFDARHPCMIDLFMLMQMVSDVNLLRAAS